MEAGQPSRTALRVAGALLTLNEVPGWSARFPKGLPELTERLILSARIAGFGPDMVARCKSPGMVKRLLRYERHVPGMFQGLGRRKIFMERQFEAARAIGIRQVAVIGAGFDTLALRQANNHPDIQFLEIDHPATQISKGKALGAVGPWPNNLTLYAADLADISMLDILKAAEEDGTWDRRERALFVVEGVLMYLNRPQVRDLFEALARAAGPSSRTAFSHIQSLNRYPLTGFLVRLMGEPWQSAAKPYELPGYLPPIWRIIDQASGQSKADLEGFALAERLNSASIHILTRGSEPSNGKTQTVY